MAKGRGERLRGRSGPRPPSRLDRRVAIGVDLGGTKIALGLVNATGKVLESDHLPTRAGRPASRIVEDIARRVELRWGARLPPRCPVGVGVAGQIDREGTVRFGPNLGWHNVPLQERLADLLGRPVAVLNDVQAATYGEWRHGAGRGIEDVVCVFVGTGVGGGVIADGRLYAGAFGTAGEFGHTTVEVGGRRCHCRNAGCLEAYAGGWAIARRAQEAVAAEPRRGARLVDLAGSRGKITSKTVEEGFLEGDPLARELVEETTRYLAAGLVSIVNAVDPGVLVLGGGVLEGFPAIVPELGRRVHAAALEAASRRLKVARAELGPMSGVVGAASFARELAPAG